MLRFLVMLVVMLLASGPASASLPKLERLERELQLTPPQKEQLEVAVAATRRAGVAMAAGAIEMKERLREELAKPWPDLRVLAEMKDAVVDRTRSLRREAREEWLRFYAMLDRAQVATLKSMLELRLDSLDGLHDFMLEMFLGRRPARPEFL